MDTTSFSQSFVSEIRENFDDIAFSITELDEQMAQVFHILKLISDELDIKSGAKPNA